MGSVLSRNSPIALLAASAILASICFTRAGDAQNHADPSVPPARVVLPHDQQPIPGLLLIDPPPEIPPAPVSLPIVNHGYATDEDIPGPLEPLIADLAVTNIDRREAASHKLMRLPPSRLGEVTSALEKQTDPEAIARLANVAEHLYLKERTPLAPPSLLGVWYDAPFVSLLGIKFDTQQIRLNPADADDTSAVAVMDIEPGFPAAQTLETGDRILGINGQRFPPHLDRNEFPDLVRQYHAGALLTLTILRAGKTTEVQVQMAGIAASATDLQTAVEERQNAGLAFLRSLKTARKDMPTLGSADAVD